MNGERKSALMLHGMAEPDRAWMLQQLPETERSTLQALLTELNQLCIPADPHLSAHLADPSHAGGSAAQDAHHEALLAFLEKEPVWMLNVVLGEKAWPWRAALLARFDPVHRQALAAAAPRALGPKLRAALAAQLELHGAQGVVPAGQGAVSGAPRRRAFEQVAEKVRSWLR